MKSWWELIRGMWRRTEAKPQPPSHLGGRDIPNILGVCQDCGAVVVEGLHKPTPNGFLCQRCAASGRNREA